MQTSIGFYIQLATLVSLTWSACAPTRKELRGTPPVCEIFMEPLIIGLQPDSNLGLTDFDAATLFNKGVELQEAGLFERALVFYKRLLRDFSASRYVSATAFNAGRCLEELDQPEQAIAHYRLITAELPSSRHWIDAGFRESICLLGLHRFQEASELLERILERSDLYTSDRLEATVMLGESLFGQGMLLKAEKHYRSALNLYHAREREEYLDPYVAGKAQYLLSRMAEDSFRTAPLRLPEKQIQQDLEAKATLLIQAQASYLRTIRLGDPGWATDASYRIGTLYLHLHGAIQQAPVPENLSQEEIKIYNDLLRQRTLVLLRKALRIFELTIQLAEQTQTQSPFVQEARKEMARIEAQILSFYDQIP